MTKVFLCKKDGPMRSLLIWEQFADRYFSDVKDIDLAKICEGVVAAFMRGRLTVS